MARDVARAAIANEEHATLLLKELKADYELVKARCLACMLHDWLTSLFSQLELLATKIKADAEAKALLRIVNRLTAEKEYTVKTLVQKCVAAAPARRHPARCVR